MKRLLLVLVVMFSVAGASARSQNNKTSTLPAAISLYPNPASGTININYEAQSDSNISVMLTDMSGRSVLLKTDKLVKPGTNKLTYSMAGVPVGSYTLRIQSGADVTTTKVMVVE